METAGRHSEVWNSNLDANHQTSVEATTVRETNMAAQESATKQDNSEDNVSDIIMIQASKNSFSFSGID